MALPISELIVEVDTREQYPIPFPATLLVCNQWTDWKRIALPVKVVRKTMPYGDYRLQWAPTCCVVERKASKMELTKNLFDSTDLLRCGRAFARLRDNADHPVLLVEMSPSEFFKDPDVPSPDDLLHRLYLASSQYGFSLLWVPRTSDRRYVGINILHLLLAHALQKHYASKGDS